MSTITTEMAAVAIRSAVSRSSLFQGSAALLRAAAEFFTAWAVVDISSCAYNYLLVAIDAMKQALYGNRDDAIMCCTCQCCATLGHIMQGLARDYGRYTGRGSLSSSFHEIVMILRCVHLMHSLVVRKHRGPQCARTAIPWKSVTRVASHVVTSILRH